ncbi:MAG: 6-carboxytetrahydropterin synthase [Nitrosopumilaceae archaeon]|nr:6-carboxytetrahydropterin synthase [Nitrosopumilaceae archaeon]
MTTNPAVVDSDFRYLDKKGNLMRSRTELSISQMLTFLNQEYEYDYTINEEPLIKVDFKTKDGLIQVIDSDEDIKKYNLIKEKFPETKIMAIGHPKFAAQVKELEEIVFYDKTPQTGSIFLEDPSFSFDYAHILPLVEKCSILHGHTSSVMVDLVGQMKNNLLVDFGEAKKIIKEVIGIFDHKFFINKKYLKSEDESHYRIGFNGPKGMFDLQVPKHTTYLLEGEATVENLSTEIIKLLSPKLPENIEAVGVYIYEGYNKGSHIISNISQK